jgi:hypothetical protein
MKKMTPRAMIKIAIAEKTLPNFVRVVGRKPSTMCTSSFY